MTSSFDDDPIDDLVESDRSSIYQLTEDSLPEDADRPAAPPTPTSDALPLDHPSGDTDLDTSEVYENGQTDR